MTKLPRLYIKDKFSRLLNPISVGISERSIPLSTATIELMEGEEIPIRSYVELFTPYGSAGMYRVRAPRTAYGAGYTSAEMEHMIAEVGDYVVKAELSDMMAAKSAITTIFGHYKGSHWKLGSYSVFGSQRVAVDVSYTSVLTAMLNVMNQVADVTMTFDFTTTPWTVGFAKRKTAVAAEGRLSRNVKSAEVIYDDSGLVTRLWYQTWSKNAEGTMTGTWTHKDADTLKTYGVVESSISTNADMEAGEIDLMVNTYLREHKAPKASIDIRADELYTITRETLDRFRLGDLMRLTIPDYSLTVELNITQLTWENVYSDTDSLLVHLGDEEDTVVTFIHNLDATGAGISGGSGGGGSARKGAQEDSEYKLIWDIANDHIHEAIQKTDKNGKILEAAGLQINSKGVLIYADNGTKQSLWSKFHVTNESIKAEVQARRTDTKNLKSSITQTASMIRAEVVDEVNGLQSSITQTASMIRTEVANTVSGLSSRITQTADKVSIVVDDNNNLKTASIVAGINAQTGSFIKLSADKIDLSGYVTASSLEAVDAKIGNLTSGVTQMVLLNVYNIDWKAHRLITKNITINGTEYHLIGYN